MADAWATDHAEGHDTALLAWRRDDVADLNWLARDRWDALGGLHGDDVQVDGGRHYAIGDRLVALAPNSRAGIVTSEALTVLAVDEQALTVRTSQRREVTLTGEGIDNQHLDYGYAVTVHRAQGATYDRAKVLAAGGGRELAYVALSRARDGTTIHATADDLDQAVEDIQADWDVTRHQRWITDTTAELGRQPEPQRATSIDPHQSDRSRLTGAEVRTRLASLEHDLSDLIDGAGRWEHTPAGSAARGVIDATDRLRAAHRVAEDPTARRRDRRAAMKSLGGLTDAMNSAEQRWRVIGGPVAEQLQSQISAAEAELIRISREAAIQRLDSIQQRSVVPEPTQAMGILM